MNKVAVIGTGPSGWATTQRLIEFGIQVDIFDSSIVEEDAQVDNPVIKNNSINRKLLYGSDYPYRSFPSGPKILSEGIEVSPSFATSGLSLVWGATMLPYREEDIAHWCIGRVELDKGYDWVSSRVPISGRKDGMSEEFNGFISRPPLLPTSRLLRLLEKVENSKQPDFIVGSSSLAVYSSEKGGSGCLYCKKCLTGCPIDIIWKAPKVNQGSHRYFNGLRVLKIGEIGNSYQLSTINKKGELSSFGNYERVFIACGPVESFRILATSKMVNSHATLLDSQTFFMPILASFGYRGVDKEYYSLSQIFCQLKELEITKSQLQIYDYSDDLIERAYKAASFIKLLPSFFVKVILQRMFVGIGYLNDSDSAKINMKLDEFGNVSLDLINGSGERLRKEVKRISRTYRNKLSRFGLIPLTFLTQVASTGQGVHYGGWLPMGSGADRLGQPGNYLGIHVVDSSVFPSIPAGPITFTIMANAVRIVEEIYK